MAIQTTLPTTNLTFDDIRDTLNNFGGSVTNEVVTAFQSTAKVSRWSRNKPESFAKDFDLTDTERKNNNFGLTVPSLSSITSLFNSNVWSYTLPSGGSSSPYRLSDFRGYYVYAPAPVSSTSPSKIKDTASSTSNYVNGFVMQFNSQIMYWTVSSCIGLQELTSYPNKMALSDLYPGVAFRWYSSDDPSTWNYFYVTAANTVGAIINGLSSTAVDQSITLKGTEAPWRSKLSSGYTITVEAAYGLFGTMATSVSTDTGVSCVSVETTSGANKKSYTVTRTYPINNLTCAITASYTINGTSVTINSVSVSLTSNADFRELPVSVYMRPYVTIVHNNGTVTQKFITGTDTTNKYIQSVAASDWSTSTNETKTFTWESGNLSSRTFSVSGTKQNITFHIAMDSTLSTLTSATTLSGLDRTPSINTTNVATNGTFTASGTSTT